MSSKTVKIGEYEVNLVLDEDNHLSMYVSNDKNDILEVDEDIQNEGMFAVRLTTEETEKSYNQK